MPRELLAVGWEVLAALGGPCSLLQSTCTAHLTLKLCSVGHLLPEGPKRPRASGRDTLLFLCVSQLTPGKQ